MLDSASAFVFGVGIFAILGLVAWKRIPRNHEGFTTIALGEDMPKCFTRDTDAQELMKHFQGLKIAAPSSNAAMSYDELQLILTKVLCMDADITGMGSGPFSTYQLPFATSHDIEPVASFVSRCIKHSATPRDLEVAMAKYYERGVVLIGNLCYDEKTRKWAHDKFHSIITRVTGSITFNCMNEKATLDRPSGARDPGYSQQRSSLEQGPYNIQGDFQYF
jgi:hypothetical protein